jgi:SpoVK/Ycf46/Vps4 family AAA+-type ATPase
MTEPPRKRSRRGRRPDEQPQITLADIGGLEDVKRRLEISFIGPMRSPELRQAYRISLRGGMLLWGPPGCGKTLVARAVAGEMGAEFINVALNDVLSMWLGNSERNIHAVFEAARNQAPALLFIDELDAIGHKRTGFANTSGRNVVAQMLMEMEGVSSDNTGVYMLAATNQPWAVDPALRRPGRFDRTILVLPPDEAARRAILAYHLKDRPLAPIDLRPFAAETEGYSGADLGLVCRDAAELAMADSLATGTLRPIDAADLATALRGVRPSTLEWIATARSFAADARSAGEYDGLLEYLKNQAAAGAGEGPAGAGEGPAGAGEGPAGASEGTACQRCGRPVVVREQGPYAAVQGMHWVCFHYEFEHGDHDVDAACKDPACPSRMIDKKPPVDWITERGLGR